MGKFRVEFHVYLISVTCHCSGPAGGKQLLKLGIVLPKTQWRTKKREYQTIISNSLEDLDKVNEYHSFIFRCCRGKQYNFILANLDGDWQTNFNTNGAYKITCNDTVFWCQYRQQNFSLDNKIVMPLNRIWRPPWIRSTVLSAKQLI